jgi:hypothetical protein
VVEVDPGDAPAEARGAARARSPARNGAARTSSSAAASASCNTLHSPDASPPGEQVLDIVYHTELGIDDHIDTIRAENDMDP